MQTVLVFAQPASQIAGLPVMAWVVVVMTATDAVLLPAGMILYPCTASEFCAHALLVMAAQIRLSTYFFMVWRPLLLAGEELIHELHTHAEAGRFADHGACRQIMAAVVNPVELEF